MLKSGKVRPSQFAAVFDALDAEVFKRKRNVGIGCITAIITVVTGFCGCQSAFTNSDVGEVGGAFGFMGLIVGAIVAYGAWKSARRAEEKADFARELTMALFDDFHPARKVHYFLDLRNYDADDKQYWSGLSRHGNSKYKYEDRWFRLKFDLVDGSTVVIERRGDYKVRKGNLIRHKRRLYLRFVPNPEVHGHGPWGANRSLHDLVRQAVRSVFHDPPEGISVKGARREGHIHVKIFQLDAPILGEEVVAVLEAILLHLRMSA